MLRVAVARSSVCIEQGARRGLQRQWQLQRLNQPLTRGFADEKPTDKTVLPGSQSTSVAGVPQPPVIATVTQNPTPTTSDLATEQPPKTPPTPNEVNAKVPPTGSSSARAPKPKRRFRNFLLTLIILSALGYGSGVYFSLVNDNFHDFFTEYVPFGEDSVAYFEEREFRRRFPARDSSGRNWPQTRGENKVTIGRQSGVTPRVAQEGGSSSSGSESDQKGRHINAAGDNQARAPETKKAEPKKDETPAPKTETRASEKPAATAQVASLVDSQQIAENTEPAVQELIKIINNIITAVNTSPEASKYASTITTAKQNLNAVIGEIKAIRDQAAQDAESKIKGAHSEFDDAAKELVRRLEREMQEQEARWREEYEQEREKLSISYQQKLSAELDAAKKVLAQKNENALLEQEIALQKKFTDSVKAKIEEERNGRLSKLDELSSSVQELEKLTGEWNEVVDATLQTQHLQVALEAVKAKLQRADHPTPFINELVALKEVSKDNNVVNAAIASINPAAYQRGIPSAAALIDRFRRVATEVRKASLLPEDAGVASHVASAVLSRFMFQKKSDRGLPAGDDVEATLARTEVLLEEGDLDAAAREMNALQGWAGVLSRDWVSECRRVLEVRQAVEVISTEARLQSLLVE